MTSRLLRPYGAAKCASGERGRRLRAGVLDRTIARPGPHRGTTGEGALKVYVASSWRNARQPEVVAALRAAGHEVHDYKAHMDGGLAPDGVDVTSLRFEPAQFRMLLEDPRAHAWFQRDMDALRACDACVLVLPCGRSAHLELGYAVGAGKLTIALLAGECEPDLMYKMIHRLCVSLDEVVQALAEARAPVGAR